MVSIISANLLLENLETTNGEAETVTSAMSFMAVVTSNGTGGGGSYVGLHPNTPVILGTSPHSVKQRHGSCTPLSTHYLDCVVVLSSFVIIY